MRRSRHESGEQPPTLEETRAAIEKRLFIGKVQPGATEWELRETYGHYGTLTECRLLLEKGVAFVAFDTWGSAHRALADTDGQPALPSCAGANLVVSFAERSGSGRGSGWKFAKGLEHNRIFVGGLPEVCSDQDLRSVFEAYGRVDGASVLKSTGQRGRCGFVNFSLWGEALDAIEALHQKPSPLGNGADYITVVFAQPPGRGRDGPAYKFRRSDAEYGPSSGSYGAGGSEFDALKAAYLSAVEGDAPPNVCDDLHRKIMASRHLRERSSRRSFGGSSDRVASPMSPRMSPPPPWSAGGAAEDRDANRLFVAGIPMECSDKELEALVTQLEFSVPPSQSQLLECRVLQGRACGYLRFSSWQAASEAMQNLDGRDVNGWVQPLRVRWASPKTSSAGAGGFVPAPCSPAPPRAPDHAQSALTAALGAVGAAVQKQHGAGPLDSLLSEVQQLLSSNTAAELGAALEAQGLGPLAHGAAAVDPEEEEEEHVLRGQGLDPRRLFVGQLTRELTDQNRLVQLFQSCGAIEHVRFLQDKGVAYIQFEQFAAAKRAHDSLSGKHFPGISREQGLNLSFSRLR